MRLARSLAPVTLALLALPRVLPAQRPGSVEVRYTPLGVAHVRAGTLEAAGEGYGWAFARDNLCLLIDKAVTLAGERSTRMGGDGSYVDGLAGGVIPNRVSDVAYRYLLAAGAVDSMRRAASRDVHALVRGYVRGVNRHIDGTPLPGEECRTTAWFRPLFEDDLWRRLVQVPLLMTSVGLLKELVAAAPPTVGAPPARDAASLPSALADHPFVTTAAWRLGSNALGVGRAVLGAGSGGFSFSNPHFPWQGTERLHAMHLTVPGRLDTFGSTLYGVPFPMIGFTPFVGWSATHTTDKRSTLYQLTLDPADPTRYRVGDRYEPMRRVTVLVPAGADTVRHVVHESRYGPIVVPAGLPWSATTAWAFADPERGNVRWADQFLALSGARSVHDLRAALARHLGSPWSNITAADRDGGVLFANVSVAGYITDAQWQRCAVTGPARRWQDLADLTVLDGAGTTCAWTVDPRAPQRGIIPAALRPSTIRHDVALNSNDSHWLPTTSPRGVLEGYLAVIGPERTARGERTRVAALHVATFAAVDAPRRGPPLTPAGWEARFYGSRNLTAELVLDDLLADCRATPTVPRDGGGSVSLEEPCRALAAWDRTDRLDARGSALFGEFVRQLERVPMTGFSLAPRYWRVPFDPADPIGTPRGFVPSDETRRALAQAAARLAALGVAPDAPLGAVQGATRNGRRYPLSGASYTYHMAVPGSTTPGAGITDLRHGDSYIHAVSLTRRGPSGRFLVTYSQSTNPSSPHFADMTAVYSSQAWADVAFSPEEIRRAQVGATVTWRAGGDARGVRTR